MSQALKTTAFSHLFEVDFSETYLMTSAENSISEPPNFLGQDTTRPPYKTGLEIFVFVSASLNCPDFLFRIVIVSGPNFITVLISIWYYTYQDPFSASEVTQFLPFSEVREMPLFQRATKPRK